MDEKDNSSKKQEEQQENTIIKARETTHGNKNLRKGKYKTKTNTPGMEKQSTQLPTNLLP